MLRTARIVVATLAAACALAPGARAEAAATTPSAPAVWIDEIHYDNAATDTAEGIEVAGIAGTDLTGWSIHLHNGFDGREYGVIALGGTIPLQQEGHGTRWFAQPGLQNGAPDGVALVDGAGGVEQLLSYEGAFVAADGPAAGRSSTPIGPFEHPSSPVGRSLQLTGTGTRAADLRWTVGPASPGAVNGGTHFTSDGAGAEDRPALDQPDVADGLRLGTLRIRGRVDLATSTPTVIRYVVSRPAAVHFTIRRVLRWHRAGDRCEPIPAGVQRSANCHGAGPVLRSFSADALAGRNLIELDALRSRSLTTGLYRLTVSADGHVRRTTFRVVG